MTYTITRNDAFQSVDIAFDSRPSEAVRNVLKSLRFRWHAAKKVWYGYGINEDDARAAIESVMTPGHSEAATEAAVKAAAAPETPRENDPCKFDKRMLNAQYAMVWSDHMLVYCVGKTAALAELPGGELFPVEKQSIETRFCFGESGYDYDDALKAATIEGKSIRIGKMVYKTLVSPGTKWMEADAKAKVAAFRKAGGKVVAPEKIDTIAPTLKVSPANEWIRVQKRVYGDEVLYFVVNEGPDPADVVLHIPEAGELQRFNAEDGKRYSIARKGREPLAWHFNPYDSVVLVANAASAADLKMPVYRTLRKWNLADGWTIRTSRNYTVTKDHYAREDKLGAPKKAALGDWRKFLGDDFSGEAIYKTEFEVGTRASCPCNTGKMPVLHSFHLDLGKVSYSCTVLVNGKEIGRKFWGPFEFAIPAGVLKEGKNTLEVKVTNTYANAIQSKKTQDMWDKYYPEFHKGCLYEVYEKSFESDSLPSGLFGPVVLSRKKRLN